MIDDLFSGQDILNRTVCDVAPVRKGRGPHHIRRNEKKKRPAEKQSTRLVQRGVRRNRKGIRLTGPFPFYILQRRSELVSDQQLRDVFDFLSDLMGKCVKEKVEISIRSCADGDYEIEITPWAPTKFTTTSEPVDPEDI